MIIRASKHITHLMDLWLSWVHNKSILQNKNVDYFTDFQRFKR